MLIAYKVKFLKIYLNCFDVYDVSLAVYSYQWKYGWLNREMGG
jgi:hypothetical protein